MDAVIAEGTESGGHVGEMTTMALVPQVVDAVSVPVIAAGGIADGETAQLMRQKGVDAVQSLNDNDAYHALGAVGGLIKTGATGTNVNDVTVLLLRTAE